MNIRILKITLCALVALFIGLGLCALKYKNDENTKRYYKQGMEFYKKENYSDAYYNFKQITAFSDLYQLALIKEYFCAIHLNDKKTARAKLLELLKHTKDKNIRPWALYNETLLAQELKTNSDNQLIKKYRKIYNLYPDNDFAFASAYKAASLTLDKDKNFTKERFIEYLKYAPSGKYSTYTLDYLKNSDIFLLEEDNNVMANAYFANSKYEEALEFYKKSDFSKNWDKIAKCYKMLNKKEEEKSTILKALELTKSSVDEKEASLALDRLISLSGGNKIQILQDLYTKYPDSKFYPTILYNLAESGQSIRSIKLYEYITRKYPDSIWASNSLWELFWHNYKLHRYQTCIGLAQSHALRYPDSQDAPRVAYWHARALLKEKRTSQAREIFYKVAREYPLSYYAFLSARQLKISKAKKFIIKKPILSYDIKSVEKFLFHDNKILLKLAQNGDWATIEEFKINDEYIKSWIMYQKQNYPLSIKTARDEHLKNITPENKISFSNKELKLIYPVLEEEEINKYAQKYNQSPYLMMSLIREESHFNKNAKSSAGAVGLAQLLKPTAEFIEKKPVAQDVLISDSIRMGIKYFDYLKNQFNDNEYLAILAYNAGPGNIKKWLNDEFITSNEIDEFVENIPYLETKNYIKKILSSYWAYINIYAPKNAG